MVFVDWLTRICLSKEIITPEEAEWFSYGIIRRLSTLFAFFILFPIGCYFSTWDTALSFLLSFFFLRKRTNGYHAKSFVGCLFFSICSMYIVFSLILPKVTREIALFSSITSSVIIFVFAPFNHPNLRLTKSEQQISARKAKTNTVLLTILVLCTQNTSYYNISVGVSLGVGYTAVLLLLAYYFTNRGGQIKNGKEISE